MTPQHILAIEIMSECGMSPHEIASHAFANSIPERSFRYPVETVEMVCIALDSYCRKIGGLDVDISKPFQEAA